MPNLSKPWTLASLGKLIERFRSNGVLVVFLWLLVPIAIVIAVHTSHTQWDKPTRFIALLVGTPVCSLGIAVLMERFKMMLLLLALLVLIFVVGVLVWVSI